MYLKGGTRDHFLGYIASEFPEMLEGFEKLYPGAYVPGGYASSVRRMVNALQERYGIAPRVRKEKEPRQAGGTGLDPEAAREQPTFQW